MQGQGYCNSTWIPQIRFLLRPSGLGWRGTIGYDQKRPAVPRHSGREQTRIITSRAAARGWQHVPRRSPSPADGTDCLWQSARPALSRPPWPWLPWLYRPARPPSLFFL